MKSLEHRLEQLEKARRQRESAERQRTLIDGPRVQYAIRDTHIWVTEFTKTYNEHWAEEGRPSPYESFPKYEYLKYFFAILDLDRVTWCEKSRDLMVSWACVAYLTLQAMKVPERGVLFQTQKKGESKATDQVRQDPLRQPATVAERSISTLETPAFTTGFVS